MKIFSSLFQQFHAAFSSLRSNHFSLWLFAFRTSIYKYIPFYSSSASSHLRNWYSHGLIEAIEMDINLLSALLLIFHFSTCTEWKFWRIISNLRASNRIGESCLNCISFVPQDLPWWMETTCAESFPTETCWSTSNICYWLIPRFSFQLGVCQVFAINNNCRANINRTPFLSWDKTWSLSHGGSVTVSGD